MLSFSVLQICSRLRWRWRHVDLLGSFLWQWSLQRVKCGPPKNAAPLIRTTTDKQVMLQTVYITTALESELQVGQKQIASTKLEVDLAGEWRRGIRNTPVLEDLQISLLHLQHASCIYECMKAIRFCTLSLVMMTPDRPQLHQHLHGQRTSDVCCTNLSAHLLEKLKPKIWPLDIGAQPDCNILNDEAQTDSCTWQVAGVL